MGRFTTARDRKQGAVAIIGCVFLFTAFGVLVYGRFATSVGAAALYNRASVGVGFILFGISMLCFTPMVYLQRMHRRHVDSAVLARELKGILLGFFCYVVPFFLAMGALSSADTTGVFGLVLMVAFGAIPFVYRRHRKKDPISYKHTGSAAIVAFCGVFAVISIAGGAFSCSEMLDDLNGRSASPSTGPRSISRAAAGRRCRPPRSRSRSTGTGSRWRTTMWTRASA